MSVEFFYNIRAKNPISSPRFDGCMQNRALNYFCLQRIEAKRPEFEAAGCQLLVNRVPMVVTLVSPLMARVRESCDTDGVLFIDTTGNCDGSNCAVTPILIQTPIGALPLSISVSGRNCRQLEVTGKLK